MKGRWAAGIVPRNFNWIIRDHLAVSERPGGYAPNHRRVRRQEEILWLRGQGFSRVVSLLGSTHNLHAYDELGVTWSHFPYSADTETRDLIGELYPALAGWLRSGERILLHQEELGDKVMGVVAGYLRWSRLLPEGPRAISAVEQIVRRQMGTVGRSVVALVDEIPAPQEGAAEAAGGVAGVATAGDAADAESGGAAVAETGGGPGAEAASPEPPASPA